MKKIFFTALIVFLVLLSSGTIHAIEFNMRSSSYLRLLRDSRMLSNNNTYVPFYEYLDVATYDFGVDGLSFHISGWGRGDFTSNTGGGRRGDGQLVYGYLKWRAPRFNFDVQAGRQYVISGPASMRGRYVDGLNLKTDLFWGLGIETLAGSPVYSFTSGRSGDIVAQGRLFRRWGKSAEAGVSYAYITDDGERDQENIGFDLWLHPKETLDGNFHSYYDSIAGNFADIGANIIYSPIKIPWSFSASYNYVTPSDFLSRSSIFFVFSDTAYHNAGLNVSYFVTRYLTIDAGAEWYHYTNDTDASRFGADATWRYGRHGRHTLGVGAHRLKEFESGITEARLFNRFYIIRKLSLSGDLYGYFYDESIRGRSFSFTCVGALNYELPRGFAVAGAVDVSSNPYFNADVRGMLNLTYRFGGSSSAF